MAIDNNTVLYDLDIEFELLFLGIVNEFIANRHEDRLRSINGQWWLNEGVAHESLWCIQSQDETSVQYWFLTSPDFSKIKSSVKTANQEFLPMQRDFIVPLWLYFISYLERSAGSKPEGFSITDYYD